MKAKCIIVDDEPLAISAIENHISKINDIEILAKCTDAIEAFDVLKNNKVDLIFLDIEMPELNGVNLLKSLKNPPAVIFTTAYRNYAIEAFDLDIVDYLLKPIEFDRFLRAIERFYSLIKSKKEINTDLKENDECLKIKANKKTHIVYYKEIIYIENIADYLQIITSNKKITTKMAIRDLEEILPNDRFIRIHRSYIISIKNIESYTNHSVTINQVELPVSRSYRKTVFSVLNKK